MLAAAEIPRAIKAEDTVGVGDLVVGEPAGGLRVLLGQVARGRRTGWVREAHCSGRGEGALHRDGSGPDISGPGMDQIVEPDDSGH